MTRTRSAHTLGHPLIPGEACKNNVIYLQHLSSKAHTMTGTYNQIIAHSWYLSSEDDDAPRCLKNPDHSTFWHMGDDATDE
jgi:hypothetical protein